MMRAYAAIGLGLAAACFYLVGSSDRDFYAEKRRTPKPGCHQRWKMDEHRQKKEKQQREQGTPETPL